MKKIYCVIAHLSDGDVLISPNRRSLCFGFEGKDRMVILPGFQDIEEAQATVEAHKATFPGVKFEIVPKWWGFDVHDIILKAENGRWCPVTREKLQEAVWNKTQAVDEDTLDIEFLCKNKLCSISIDEDRKYHFTVEDPDGEVKEKILPFNPHWFSLYSFKPALEYSFCMEAATIFLELLKK